MARHQGAVLVDTNVIIECARLGYWRALGGGYRLETVAMIEAEAGTGQGGPRLAPDELRRGLAAIHPVDPPTLAAALVRDEALTRLDAGERDLWAHALTRSDGWVLCGPDAASLRVGLRLGLRERLVALETLLRDVGHKAKGLRTHYTRDWHERTLARLAQQEGLGA